MIQVGNEMISLVQLGFGTAAVTPLPILQKKLALAGKYHILIMPGGTFFEVGVMKGTIAHFFARSKQLGFTGIEVSDGTIHLSRAERHTLIQQSCEAGFIVCTEFEKKTHPPLFSSNHS